MLICNCVDAPAFRQRSVRRNIAAVVTIGIVINIGMWLERITIVWNTLSHDYAKSMWRVFYPTVWDYLLLLSSLGLFALLYLVMCRFVPVVSMHETRRLIAAE